MKKTSQIDVLQRATREAIFERINKLENEISEEPPNIRVEWCYLITMALLIMLFTLCIALGAGLIVLYWTIMYNTRFEVLKHFYDHFQ